MTIKEWLRSYISEEEAVELYNMYESDEDADCPENSVYRIEDFDELMTGLTPLEVVNSIDPWAFHTWDTYIWLGCDGWTTGNKPIGGAEAENYLNLTAFRAWIPNHLDIVREMGINTSSLERSLANDRAD